jgi:hypothetical protein
VERDEQPASGDQRPSVEDPDPGHAAIPDLWGVPVAPPADVDLWGDRLDTPTASLEAPPEEQAPAPLTPEQVRRRGLERLRRALVRAERAARDAGAFAEDLTSDVLDDLPEPPSRAVAALVDLADGLEDEVAGRLAHLRRELRRGRTNVLLPGLRAAERSAAAMTVAARDAAEVLEQAGALGRAADDLRAAATEVGERVRSIRRALERE